MEASGGTAGAGVNTSRTVLGSIWHVLRGDGYIDRRRI